MTKLSKAQQTVIDDAKKEIDYARTHSFYDWFRYNSGRTRIKTMTDEEVSAELDRRTVENWFGNWSKELEWYEMNRNGISYKCHASSKTIKKLEEMGLIEIIYDSNGEYYGFDTIKILNY